MKARIGTVLAAAAVLLAACQSSGGTPTQTSTESNQGKTIALSLPFASAPFYWAAANGLKDEGERLGFKVIVNNADNSVEAQVSELNNYKTQHVAAVSLISIDADALDPAINNLMAAQIPVFAIDRDVHTTTAGFLVTDNVAGGKALGDYVKTKMGGKPIYALALHGGLNVIPFVERLNGFLSSFAGDQNFHLVGTPNAEVDPAKALAITKAYMQSHPEINVIFSVTDIMDAGAVAALKEMGKSYPIGDPNHIMIVSVDGNGETLNQVRQGTVDACFSQYPYLIGVWTARVMNDYVHGRGATIPRQLYFGGDLVTKDSVASFKSLWGDHQYPQIAG